MGSTTAPNFMTVMLPRRRSHALLVLTLSGLVAGCAATPQQPAAEPEAYLDQQAQRVESEGVALLGDGCVISDKPGRDDAVIRNLSIRIGEAAADGLRRVLEDAGAPPQQLRQPGFCAGAKPVEADRRIRISETERKPVRRRRVSDTFIATDATDRILAEYRLMDRVKQTALQDTRTEYGARPLELADADLATLRDHYDSPLLWVYRVYGVAVDERAATRARYGQRSSFDRFAPTPDGVSESGEILNQDEEDSYGYVVGLVDLSNGDMLWYKRSTDNVGDPRQPELFYQSWARRAMRPFYPRR